MNVFNRAFISLLALTWCALLAGLLYLVWEQVQSINVDNSAFTLSFDLLAETQAEKILATLVLAALMLPAAALLLMEVLVRGRGRRTALADGQSREREQRLEARVEQLQHRLDQQGSTQSARPAEAQTYDRGERRRWGFLPSRH